MVGMSLSLDHLISLRTELELGGISAKFRWFDCQTVASVICADYYVQVQKTE